MRARPLPAGLALVALLASGPSSTGHDGHEHGIQIFPGPIQPDAGTVASSSRNGHAVAFAASWRDAGAGRYDAAATPTVFAWNRRTGELRQATATGPCDQPSAQNGTVYVEIGAAEKKEHRDRTLVAFRSTANLATQNADGSAEIFLWDSSNGAITQVTRATAASCSDPALGARFVAAKDANGLYTGVVNVRTRLSFLSNGDLTGDNPGNLVQVFQHDSGGDAVARLLQVSHATAGTAGPPAVDGEGKLVAFVHDGDLLPGPDAPGTPAVYLWSQEGGLRRATDEPGACEGAADVALDARGRNVAWTSTDGPGGPRRVMVAAVKGGRLREFAPSSGDHRLPALGRGDRPLVFLSTDPGDGGAPVAERPVALGRGGRIRDLGLAADGTFGGLALQVDRSRLFLTTTSDLDGRNASNREVVYVVPFPRK